MSSFENTWRNSLPTSQHSVSESRNLKEGFWTVYLPGMGNFAKGEDNGWGLRGREDVGFLLAEQAVLSTVTQVFCKSLFSNGRSAMMSKGASQNEKLICFR